MIKSVKGYWQKYKQSILIGVGITSIGLLGYVLTGNSSNKDPELSILSNRINQYVDNLRLAKVLKKGETYGQNGNIYCRADVYIITSDRT